MDLKLGEGSENLLFDLSDRFPSKKFDFGNKNKKLAPGRLPSPPPQGSKFRFFVEVDISTYIGRKSVWGVRKGVFEAWGPLFHWYVDFRQPISKIQNFRKGEKVTFGRSKN